MWKRVWEILLRGCLRISPDNIFYSLQALGCDTTAFLHPQVKPARPRLLSPSHSFRHTQEETPPSATGLHNRGEGKRRKKKKTFRERKEIHQLLSYLTSKWKRQETRLFPHCITHKRKQDRKRAGSSQQKVRRDAKFPHILMLSHLNQNSQKPTTQLQKKDFGKAGGGAGGNMTFSAEVHIFLCFVFACFIQSVTQHEALYSYTREHTPHTSREKPQPHQNLFKSKKLTQV